MPTIAPEPALHVAVGILLDRGQVFITRRDAGAHQGGKWEFPGGKCAPGESASAALKRELHEELGIEVGHAVPWMQVRHAYPDRTVTLDVWRVASWRGQPHGREGQAARWASIHELAAADFPEADLLILRRLWLPTLYLISDVQRFGKDRFLEVLERALGAGARLIQLREPWMSPQELRAYAGDVAGVCRRHGARLLLNTDARTAEECGVDGVHLNRRQLMASRSRPLNSVSFVAASCHDQTELAQAERIDADLVVLSPVMATPSHPGAATLGWEKFHTLCASVTLPVYALGGMHPDDVVRARAAGARGIAMKSGVWDAASIETVVAACASQDYFADAARAR